MNELKPIEIALNKPKDYEDNYLYPYILNRPQAFEAEILDIQQTPKITRIKFYLKNINQIMWGVFFVFKKWHKSVFKEGKTLYIRGEIRNNQLIQPKPISKINEIKPIYSSPKIKNEIKKYVTFDNLKLLPENIAKTLVKMHFPNSIDDINKKKINYALKWAEIFVYLYKLQNKKNLFWQTQLFQTQPLL
jgi:ATP-dependent DNA helicase RecG